MTRTGRFTLALVLTLFAADVASAQVEYEHQRGIDAAVSFFIRDDTGAAVAAATGIDSECTLYSGTTAPAAFEDCDDDATALGGGWYSQPLSATEMDGDHILVTVKTTEGLPAAFKINTRLAETYTGETTTTTATSITLTDAIAAAASDDAYTNNTAVLINYSSTAAGSIGQTRCITDFDAGTDTATVATWTPQPTGTVRYSLISAPNCNGAISNGGITSASFGSGAIDANAFAQAAADKVWDTATREITGGGGEFTGECTLAANAIEHGDITAEAANKIADFIWRRNNANIEAANYATSSAIDDILFQSAYGAIAKQTNTIAMSGNSLNIYRANNSTLLDSQTTTSSAGAAPITGLSN